MKKLLVTVAATAALVLSGCGAPAGHAAYWQVMGANNGWAADEEYKMTKITVEEAAQLGVDLSGKNVKEVYKFVGWDVNDAAGWPCKARVNGEVQEFDGGHAVKVAKLEWNEEGEKYINTAWIPNPGDNAEFQTAHAESLTDNLFMPIWTKDGDGDFSWADNPVITGAAGKYTIIAAEYNVDATPTQANFGLGAIAELA